MFGPILHVVRWPADRLDAVLDEIAATGYALTLGIHSRIDDTVRHILARLGVGNSYVNRNMIGAVVGAQPFGGERLSGTGPKAGGPRYLHRFATERTVSVDTTAAGGNATLLSLDDADRLTPNPPIPGFCACIDQFEFAPAAAGRCRAGRRTAALRMHPQCRPCAIFRADIAMTLGITGVAQMSRRNWREFAGFPGKPLHECRYPPRSAPWTRLTGLAS